MIIKFDTEEIPDKYNMFLAELVLIAGKSGITIDKAIQNCRDIFKK